MVQLIFCVYFFSHFNIFLYQGPVCDYQRFLGKGHGCNE